MRHSNFIHFYGYRLKIKLVFRLTKRRDQACFKVFSSEYLEKKGLVLLLEWESEPVDDGSQDLQQLSNTVVSLSLVDKAVEDIVDLFPEK